MEKLGDYHPNKRERILKPEPGSRSSPKEGPRLSRRAFLRGSLSSAVAYAAGAETLLRLPDTDAFLKDRKDRMRFDGFGSLSAQEREEKIRKEVALVHAFVRSPEGERIMNGGTPEDIFKLLAMLPPLLRKHIEGTSYEVPKDAWPSVPLVGGLGKISVQHSRDKGTPEASFVGNAAYLGGGEFLTNWHVLSAAMHEGTVPPSQYEQLSRLVKIHGRRGLDVVRIKMSAKSSRATGVEAGRPLSVLPPTIPDSNLNGSFITVASIDPDESAESDGTKAFPSVALKVTKHMANLFSPNDPHWRLPLENSYLYLMPPGEARRRPYPSRSGSRLLDFLQANKLPASSYWYAGGTSGSPVLKDGKLVGINYSAKQAEHHGISYDIGFFHPIGKVREALESGMTYDTTSVKPTVLSRSN